jgi:hypothetical protein
VPLSILQPEKEMIRPGAAHKDIITSPAIHKIVAAATIDFIVAATAVLPPRRIRKVRAYHAIIAGKQSLKMLISLPGG